MGFLGRGKFTKRGPLEVPLKGSFHVPHTQALVSSKPGGWLDQSATGWGYCLEHTSTEVGGRRGGGGREGSRGSAIGRRQPSSRRTGTVSGPSREQQGLFSSNSVTTGAAGTLAGNPRTGYASKPSAQGCPEGMGFNGSGCDVTRQAFGSTRYADRRMPRWYGLASSLV